MRIRHLQLKLVGTAAYILSLILLAVFEVPCLFLSLFGIPCPGCGMTRAYMALLQADLAGAFAHHPLFWTVPILYLYILLDGRLFRPNRLNYVGLLLLGFGFLGVWMTRL